MRTLAIDLGTRRVGLALSDEGARFATPLEVLQVTSPNQSIDLILPIIQREGVTTTVAAQRWRARLEVLAAERRLVDGWTRDRAREWAYHEVLVEWIDQHHDVAMLSSIQAEPIVRAALAELGIVEPTASRRRAAPSS